MLSTDLDSCVYDTEIFMKLINNKSFQFPVLSPCTNTSPYLTYLQVVLLVSTRPYSGQPDPVLNLIHLSWLNRIPTHHIVSSSPRLTLPSSGSKMGQTHNRLFGQYTFRLNFTYLHWFIQLLADFPVLWEVHWPGLDNIVHSKAFNFLNSTHFNLSKRSYFYKKPL